MGSLIDELQRREAAARAEAEELRGRIAELTEQLAQAEERLSRRRQRAEDGAAGREKDRQQGRPGGHYVMGMVCLPVHAPAAREEPDVPGGRYQRRDCQGAQHAHASPRGGAAGSAPAIASYLIERARAENAPEEAPISATQPGLHYVYVGLAGLEPATSCTQSTRASQAALQPVLPEHNRHVSDAPPAEGRSQAAITHTCYASSCVSARASN